MVGPIGTAPQNTTPPVISGSAAVGSSLTTTNGSWTGNPTSFTYQWGYATTSGGQYSPISGATGSSYTVDPAFAGDYLEVTVTASDGSVPGQATSASVGPVSASAPVDVLGPVVTGTVEDGQTLSTSEGMWVGGGVTYEYDWQSCDADGNNCLDLSDGSDATYTLQTSDIGTTVRVVVIATNAEGSAEATSAPTAVVVAGPPVEQVAPQITGTPNEDGALLADEGQWGGTDVSVSTQWESCDASGANCAAVQGETDNSYSLAAGDVGTTLRLVVVATNDLGSVTATSDATPVIGQPFSLAEDSPPTLSGTTQVGDPLSVSPGTWSGTGQLTYTYQWQRCNVDLTSCQAIAGATSSAYTPGTADVGSSLEVLVSVSDANGSLTDTAAPTEPIAGVGAPVISTAPVASGETEAGQILAATTGAWAGPGVNAYAYQWEDCYASGQSCAPIAGATGATYQLTPDDVGAMVRVVVTATGGSGTTPAASAAVGPVASPSLSNVSVPTIDGTPQDGVALTSTDGAWTGSDIITYAYQWQDCDPAAGDCTSIPGATSAGYTPTDGDVGSLLRVVVTATNSWGSLTVGSDYTSEVLSPPSAPIGPNTVPVIQGTTNAGDTLSIDPGDWTGEPAPTFTYQWFRCDTSGDNCSFSGSAQPANTYTLTLDDVGSTIEVAIIATNDEGHTTLYTFQTDVVGPPLAPYEDQAPVISGNPIAGQTLSASTGSWDGDQPISYSYQWMSCDAGGQNCAPISGASAQTYVLTDSEVGGTVGVDVTATNSDGATTANATTTQVVAAGPPNGLVAPSLGGDAGLGGTLSVVEGQEGGSSPIGESYMWQRCDASGQNCADIPGATTSSYTATHGDVGSTIQALVTYSNQYGMDVETVGPSAVIVDAAPSSVSAPVITWSGAYGIPGETASGTNGVWRGTAPITYSYQWQMCDPTGANCSPMEGQTTASYTTQPQDVATVVELTVTATDGLGSASATSNQLLISAASPPQSLVAPSISGTAQDGQTLTADPGSWTQDPTSYGYQWLDCNPYPYGTRCTTVAGATGQTYTLQDSDVASQMEVQVTATNSDARTTANSAATASVTMAQPVDLTPPSISGAAYTGNTFQANAGTWQSALYGLDYQWELCDATGSNCAEIPQAFESSYVAPAADAGSTLVVVVTGWSSSGSTSVMSPATPVLAPAVAPADMQPPSISGTPQDGQTLTADAGQWSGSPQLDFSYQWSDCDATGSSCAAISGATNQTYSVQRADVGQTLSVTVGAANSAGGVSVTVPATTVVTPAQAPVNVTAPSFSGYTAPRYGQIVTTLLPGTWTGDATVVDQWQRCDPLNPDPNTGVPTCTNISGATAATYTPQAADVGFYLQVTETATNLAGTASLTTAQTNQVVNYPFQQLAAAYTGAAVVGQTITANTNGLDASGLPITTDYDFQLINPDGSTTPLQDGSSPSYTATVGDYGQPILITLTSAVSRADKAEVLYNSTQTATTFAVDAAAVNQTPPSISGNPVQGATLTAAPGTWSGGGPDPAFSYQWVSCNDVGANCAAISGATTSTYMLGSGDVGNAVEVQVTIAGEPGAPTASSGATSVVGAASAPAATSVPTVTGGTSDLQTLTASPGTWSGTAPIAYAYQWLSCASGGDSCAPVNGATGQTYALAQGDIGTSLEVQVTATNAGGSATATSAPTAAIAPAAPPVNTSLPSLQLSGIPMPGTVVAADPGEWLNADTSSEVSYQWSRCDMLGGGCADIPGATQSVYNVVADDVDSRLRVQVVATNESGRAGAISPLTAIVTNIPPTYGGGGSGGGGGGTGSGVALTDSTVSTAGGGLYSANSDGSDPQQITSCGALDPASGGDCELVAPEVSPNGESVTVAEENLNANTGPNANGPSLYEINADGSGAKLIARNALFGAWTPDGTQIVYSSMSYGNTQYGVQVTGVELMEVHADGSDFGAPTQFAPDAGGTNFAASFSPDGNEVVFSHASSGFFGLTAINGSAPTVALDVANADGSDPTTLPLGNVATWATFTPDGGLIYIGYTPWAANGFTGPVPEVYESNADGSGATAITDPSSGLAYNEAAVSNDGLDIQAVGAPFVLTNNPGNPTAPPQNGRTGGEAYVYSASPDPCAKFAFCVYQMDADPGAKNHAVSTSKTTLATAASFLSHGSAMYDAYPADNEGLSTACAAGKWAEQHDSPVATFELQFNGQDGTYAAGRPRLELNNRGHIFEDDAVTLVEKVAQCYYSAARGSRTRHFLSLVASVNNDKLKNASHDGGALPFAAQAADYDRGSDWGIVVGTVADCLSGTWTSYELPCFNKSRQNLTSVVRASAGVDAEVAYSSDQAMYQWWRGFNSHAFDASGVPIYLSDMGDAAGCGSGGSTCVTTGDCGCTRTWTLYDRALYAGSDSTGSTPEQALPQIYYGCNARGGGCVGCRPGAVCQTDDWAAVDRAAGHPLSVAGATAGGANGAQLSWTSSWRDFQAKLTLPERQHYGGYVPDFSHLP
jgi:hypothetical protein